VQEKLDILTERLDQTTMGSAGAAGNVGGVSTGGKGEDPADSVDGMQAWKQSVKKCAYELFHIFTSWKGDITLWVKKK